jgi:hypothetical protein
VTTRSDAFDLADTAYRRELTASDARPLNEREDRL